ncbi:diaminopimelate decarboxylase [Alkaliphilus peptidifermentans]|uniref:Diaminopimelate decarboxylase n=1 Tax=Alkaliphilus peptidifermentans DSM 18978 TaxID=1120976 RepID=A0A1G5CJC7_9FIRM|nr:diaminopimelate decarboxylase [Alkaliphilus peptidifermentans]SCY02400.1 diaminopimelate decarboxylase [Alkaliphilus peptidifermentans DSM 18978]
MIKYYNNHLTVEDITIAEIAKDRPTPFYLYSWQQIVKNIERIKRTFEGLDYHISFAAKANNNLYLLEELKNIGIGIDIVSEGEFESAKRVGYDPANVIVNGNGKTKSFLMDMLYYQPRALNIDSKEELERLEELAIKENKSIVIALRVNPDVDPITHPYISTGLKKNKFGMDLDTASSLINKYYQHPLVQIQGLHIHIGSQILNITPYEDAYGKIYEFIKSLNNHQLTFINIGGGWGIDYLKSGKEFPLEDYRLRVIPIIKQMNLPVILELGRFIIGNAGVLVGRVEYVKKTPYKTFVVTDASMADLIRPSLYDSYHHIYPQHDTGDEGKIDIVGPLCETGDRFAEERVIPLPKNDEYIVIGDTGAYGRVMSSNYNFSLRPAEYLIKDGEIEEVRPREDFKDVTSYYIKSR